MSFLDSILNKYSKMVTPVMGELLDSYVDKENQEIVKYQVFTGGKRIRPALVLITCQLLGGKVKDAIFPAAGLEILHNYSLIIDDIIDNSTLRRNKPTTWFKFGRSIAQCVGIDYSAVVFQAANQSKKPVRMSELFAKTMKTIVDGEILDILFERAGRKEEPYIVKNRYRNIANKDYFKMVSKKTAALFKTCCEIGGIAAGASEKNLKALRNYGFNLGIAFQVQDDILDIFGEKKSFGKKIGKDITERKGGNIVIMLALKELPKSEKKRVLEIMRKKEIKSQDIQGAIQLIKKTNSLQKAYRLGKSFAEKAKENLNDLPKNKWNNILNEIANFTIERKN
ncbi:MAG: polyprenyl synthetase family protein [Candidatus Nealsonbacteria bacterium]|nr:polyprenyl synthetase family protein [Candidatus Nealsonbacteria bacterium]